MTASQQKQKQESMRKTLDMMRLQRKALATERTYLHWLGSYIDWLCEHGPGLPSTRAFAAVFDCAMQMPPGTEICWVK